jgi:hypothetical protein
MSSIDAYTYISIQEKSPRRDLFGAGWQKRHGSRIRTQAITWLEWAISPTYSARMRWIWLVLGLIVLGLCGVVYAAYLSWRKMSAGKRILGVLLLSPHFLIVVCIVVSLLCGHPPQGSRCFNTQFVCGVLIVFFLPLPALVGTSAALIIFRRARTAKALA